MVVLKVKTTRRPSAFSEKGVRLAQKMQAVHAFLSEIQLQKAEVGPTSGPTRRLSHFCTLIEQHDLSLVSSMLTANVWWY